MLLKLINDKCLHFLILGAHVWCLYICVCSCICRCTYVCVWRAEVDFRSVWIALHLNPLLSGSPQKLELRDSARLAGWSVSSWEVLFPPPQGWGQVPSTSDSLWGGGISRKVFIFVDTHASFWLALKSQSSAHFCSQCPCNTCITNLLFSFDSPIPTSGW